MSEHSDDAQRVLEQRALRNVRGLVDKLEAEDRDRNAGTLRLAMWILLGIVAFIGALLITSGYRPWSSATVVQPAPIVQASPNVPRRKFVGSSKDSPYAAYVSDYARKIERAANSNYPPALRDSYGSAQLTTAVRSDGSVESVELNKSSGNPALDAAAETFVRSAQPFAAFSTHSLTDVDVLYITRTFTFAKGAAKDPLGGG